MRNEEKTIIQNCIWIIKELNKRRVYLLWTLIFILLCLSFYKVHLYRDYKSYFSYSIKRANFYKKLKSVEEQSGYYLNYDYNGEHIRFKTREYYLLPLKYKIIVEGEGTYYNEKEKEGEKEIYGIKFHISPNTTDFKETIQDRKELEELKKDKLVYKFNEKELHEFFEKVERKIEEIYD